MGADMRYRQVTFPHAQQIAVRLDTTRDMDRLVLAHSHRVINFMVSKQIPPLSWPRIRSRTLARADITDVVIQMEVSVVDERLTRICDQAR